LFGVALLAATLGACTHASGSDPAEHPGSSAPELVAEAEPTASPQPIEAPQLSPEQAFLAVYAALRDGDWPAFERFAGADPIRYIRAGSLGDDPPEQQMIAANQAQQWLAEIQRSWAPSCMDNPDPPCRGFNPLSLGVDDPAELELRCAEPGPNEPGVVCCRHQPALLHNTPFLVDVCFDEGQRVTQVSVLDG
jgi:hypothetical protein